MSNAKTGGNKKTSSPSDQRYWQRAALSKFSETHRERRMAKHAKRMGLNKAAMAQATLMPSFPKRPITKPDERVMFKSDVKGDMRTFDEFGNITSYPTFIIKNGVTTDVLRVKAGQHT